MLLSEASGALSAFVSKTGIPVAETQAGKAPAHDHPQCAGAVGATATWPPTAGRRSGSHHRSARATRFHDGVHDAFKNPAVRFVNINTADSSLQVSAIPVVADARTTLEALAPALAMYSVSPAYAARIAELRRAWRPKPTGCSPEHSAPPRAERGDRRNVGGLRP